MHALKKESENIKKITVEDIDFIIGDKGFQGIDKFIGNAEGIPKGIRTPQLNSFRSIVERRFGTMKTKFTVLSKKFNSRPHKLMKFILICSRILNELL